MAKLEQLAGKFLLATFFNSVLATMLLCMLH